MSLGATLILTYPHYSVLGISVGTWKSALSFEAVLSILKSIGQHIQSQLQAQPKVLKMGLH